MLLKCIEMLGGQINAVDRAEIENAYFALRAKGCEPFEASVQALVVYHSDLVSEVNEMRKTVDLEPIHPYVPDFSRLTKASKVDYEGLELSREPNEWERGIDLKAISDSYDPTQMLSAVLSVRNELYIQAAKSVAQLSGGEIHTLSLVPPKDAVKKLSRPMMKAFQNGIGQIASTAKQDKPHLSTKVTSDGAIDSVGRLVELTISRIIGAVTGAAVDISATLGILNDNEDMESSVLDELNNRSDVPYQGIARQSVNTAVNEGRKEEMEARKDEIAVYVYSAILDAGTCQSCWDADGKMSENLDDLPQAPNPDCDGKANCRCFIISVFEGEDFVPNGNEVR